MLTFSLVKETAESDYWDDVQGKSVIPPQEPGLAYKFMKAVINPTSTIKDDDPLGSNPVQKTNFSLPWQGLDSSSNDLGLAPEYF